MATSGSKYDQFASATLDSLDGSRSFQEASKLSCQVKPLLDEFGIPLYGVVHEVRMSQIEAFQKHFKGEIFVDKEKKFFGDFLGMKAFLRPSVWANLKRAKNAGFEGDMEGEGRILGGVFLLKPQSDGIAFEHWEKEWGNHADPEEVVAAIKSSFAQPTKL